MALSQRCAKLLTRFHHSNIQRFQPIVLNRDSFSTGQDNKPYFALFYDYVENVLEKRAPFRPDHLKHITTYVDDGRCKLGGAFADNNVDGALIVFQCDDISEVEDFAKRDPYVLNGLVTNYKVRPWTVVAGDLYNKSQNK